MLHSMQSQNILVTLVWSNIVAGPYWLCFLNIQNQGVGLNDNKI